MFTHKSPRLVASALLVICLLAAPATLESQCMVASTGMNTLGPTMQVYKILSAPYSCSLTMMNAIFCTPTTLPQNVTFLGGTANTTMTVNASCAWNCGCGPVSIDGSDGLPVELMDFGFEDEEAAE